MGQKEEISGKPQLMGDLTVSTPTSCANRTPVVESLPLEIRRVEMNSLWEADIEAGSRSDIGGGEVIVANNLIEN